MTINMYINNNSNRRKGDKPLFDDLMMNIDWIIWMWLSEIIFFKYEDKKTRDRSRIRNTALAQLFETLLVQAGTIARRINWMRHGWQAYAVHNPCYPGSSNSLLLNRLTVHFGYIPLQDPFSSAWKKLSYFNNLVLENILSQNFLYGLCRD